MRLKGKRAVIAGGSSGIGRAIALGFAKEGADIVITYNKNEMSALQVVEEVKCLGRQAKAIKLDLLNPNMECLIKFFDEAVVFFNGHITTLINSAGIVSRKEFLNISENEFDEVMKINFKMPFFLTQKIVKHMSDVGEGGSIINISSISDTIVGNGYSIYQCSKSSLSMLTKGAALEFAKYGIRVNTISPGLTETNINKDQREKNPEIWQSRVTQTPIGRVGQPDDHVGAAIFLASDESSWMTGGNIVIDGGRSLI